jgi:uncharacterized lipoprotein YehR (DUF1307 family)
MGKVFTFLLIGVLSLVLVGCGNQEATNNTNENDNTGNQTNETVKKDLAYFKTEVKELVTGATETTVYFEMVGATDGAKIYDESEENRVEIYQFDKSSDKYKKAEVDQKICLSEDMCFDAIVKNGYALIIDDSFPQKDEVLSLFNELN